MIFKLALLVIVITAVAANPDLPEAPADGKCTPGVLYAKQCNTCICGADGTLGPCTLMECINPNARSDVSPQPSHDDLPDFPVEGKCTPGLLYKLSCNTCVCGNNGEGACTRIGCLSD